MSANQQQQQQQHCQSPYAVISNSVTPITQAAALSVTVSMENQQSWPNYYQNRNLPTFETATATATATTSNSYDLDTVKQTSTYDMSNMYANHYGFSMMTPLSASSPSTIPSKFSYIPQNSFTYPVNYGYNMSSQFAQQHMPYGYDSAPSFAAAYDHQSSRAASWNNI